MQATPKLIAYWPTRSQSFPFPAMRGLTARDTYRAAEYGNLATLFNGGLSSLMPNGLSYITVGSLAAMSRDTAFDSRLFII